MDKKWTLISIICAISVIYSLSLFFSSVSRLERIINEREEAESTGKYLLRQQKVLCADIEQLNNSDTIRSLAWKRLGMVEDGEVIFYFTDREEQ